MCACECGELFAASQRGDHAESLERPLVRRDFNTARPARELIRSRNPWVLLRLRLLGWKVRFTSASWRVNCVSAPRRRHLPGGMVQWTDGCYRAKRGVE